MIYYNLLVSLALYYFLREVVSKLFWVTEAVHLRLPLKFIHIVFWHTFRLPNLNDEILLH